MKNAHFQLPTAQGDVFRLLGEPRESQLHNSVSWSTYSFALELSTVLHSLHQQSLLGCCGGPDVTISSNKKRSLEQVNI